MKRVTTRRATFPRLVSAVATATIAALASTGALVAAPSSIDSPATPLGVTSGTVVTSVAVSAVAAGSAVADLTFGQVFAPGQVPAGTSLAAADDRGNDVALQVDEKATHPDGSLRHAVLTAAWDGSDPSGRIDLRRGQPETGPDVGLAPLLASDFDAEVVLDIGGTGYRASARDLLAGGNVTTWLTGPLVTEFHVDGPVRRSNGAAHDRITVRYAIRVYDGHQSARVETIIENTNLFLGGGARDVAYDATITVGNETVLDQDDITHYHSARFRTTAWWGASTEAHVAHDPGHVIDSRAVSYYDRSIVIDDASIEADLEEYRSGVGAQTELRRNAVMGSGLTIEYMPGTGGRADLGPLPRWGARHLLAMDPRTAEVTIGTAEQAGSFRIHHRDPATGLPIDAESFPDVTTHSNFSGRSNHLGCSTCLSVYDPAARYTSADTAHQPSLAYLPYLLTGDHYFLEELQFWAGWNPMATDPANRQGARGLVDWQQTRAQAWSLRTLAEVAYITPDDHPLKASWNRQVNHNIDRYIDRYVDGPDDNALGIVPPTLWQNGVANAPWQNDYLTWSFGHLIELGFTDAEPMRNWLARSPRDRIVANGFCWIFAAQYNHVVRDAPTAPLYTDIASVYEATVEPAIRSLPCGGQAMANALDLRPGEMTGYATSVQGYPAVMQAALASSVDAGLEGSVSAWQRFSARTGVPDFGADGPELAILPRPPGRTFGGYEPATRIDQ